MAIPEADNDEEPHLHLKEPPERTPP